MVVSDSPFSHIRVTPDDDEQVIYVGGCGGSDRSSESHTTTGDRASIEHPEDFDKQIHHNSAQISDKNNDASDHDLLPHRETGKANPLEKFCEASAQQPSSSKDDLKAEPMPVIQIIILAAAGLFLVAAIVYYLVVMH